MKRTAEKYICMDYFKFLRFKREGKLKAGNYKITLDLSKTEKHRESKHGKKRRK